MNEWMIANYATPVTALVVLLITPNLYFFRRMVRVLYKRGSLEEIVAPVVVGHVATYLSSLAVGIALNLARWAPMGWNAHVSTTTLIVWAYCISATFAVLEALTYMTWVNGHYGLSRAINRVLRIIVGAERETDHGVA